MNSRVLFALLLLTPLFLRAETEISAPESDNERQETTSEQEWESKDIIPPGGLTFSTAPITPITVLPERKTYDQALSEMAIAQELWKNGKAQAASDVSLQAYDDLMSLHLGRRNKKQRQKLRQDRHAAASLYVDSSIAYIAEYVKRNGGGPQVMEEGRARLGDLSDVAQNYSELRKKLTLAVDSYEVKSTTAPVIVPAVTTSTPTVTSTATTKS